MNSLKQYRLALSIAGLLALSQSAMGLNHIISAKTGAIVYPDAVDIVWGNGGRTGSYAMILNQVEWRIVMPSLFYASLNTGYSYSPRPDEGFDNYSLRISLTNLGCGFGRSLVFKYCEVSYGVGLSYISLKYLPVYFTETVEEVDNIFSPSIDAQLVTRISENISLIAGCALNYVGEYKTEIFFNHYISSQVFVRHGGWSNTISIGLSYSPGKK